MKLVILFFVFGAAIVHAARLFEISNVISGPIWVGLIGNYGKLTLENGGFQLNQNEEKTIKVPDDWSGRLWARTWCDPSSQHCQTGDCGNMFQCSGAGGIPPATLIEVTLRGLGGLDFYDVSLVNGFNVAASIEPVGGRGGCKTIACPNNVNTNCPEDLKVKEHKSNQTIACNSACNKYNTDEYCCKGAFGRPETCNPNTWKINSALHFKNQCPDAYSYAYDKGSKFSCSAPTYKIVFG